MSAKELKEY